MEKTVAYGVVSKGNGDAFLSDEKHTSLTIGGGQAGQGYPCVLIVVLETDERNNDICDP